MGLRSQNNPIASFRDVFSATGKDAVGAGYVAPIPEGFTATGGVISDYTEGNKVYRAHIFTSSGTFNITAGGEYDSAGIEYLVVGGGGAGGDGGGHNGNGGGGAGGLRTNLSGHPLSGGAYPIAGSFPAPYTVTVGAGGGATSDNGGQGTSGENFTHHHITLTLLHSLFVVQVEVVVETLLLLLDLLVVDLVEVNLHKHLLEVVMQ